MINQTSELNNSNPTRLFLWALGKNGYLSQLSLALSLAKKSEYNLLIVVSDNNSKRESYPTENCQLLCLPTPSLKQNPLNFLTSFAKAVLQLRADLEKQPSFIHVTMVSPYDILYLPFLKRKNANIAIIIHDGSTHPGEESLFLQITNRIAIWRSDVIVTLTNFVAQGFKDFYKSKKSVDVVKHGIVSQLGPQISPRKYPTDRPLRLIFLGRIIHYKGLDLLLGAAKLLKNRGFVFDLVVAGRGDLTPYRQSIDELGIEIENDWISDERFNDLLFNSDVVVLPYREASQSGIAYHALNAALPTIATPVGGLPECISHGQDGLITRDVSLEAISDAICHLLEDPKLYERLSIGAHFASKELTPEATTNRWLDYYATAQAKYFKKPE
jgi:glycosyltransferase involved in cell wall biosynthesis